MENVQYVRKVYENMLDVTLLCTKILRRSAHDRVTRSECTDEMRWTFLDHKNGRNEVKPFTLVFQTILSFLCSHIYATIRFQNIFSQTTLHTVELLNTRDWF